MTQVMIIDQSQREKICSIKSLRVKVTIPAKLPRQSREAEKHVVEMVETQPGWNLFLPGKRVSYFILCLILFLFYFYMTCPETSKGVLILYYSREKS